MIKAYCANGSLKTLAPGEALRQLCEDVEQNAIIKIFSCASVVFLPSTLVASIYGIDFHFMPELDWHLGYPLAILGMLLSAIIPLFVFRWKGWL